MTHEDIQERCGDYVILSQYDDGQERDVVIVECRDARRMYLREESDGEIVGPMSEGEWVNLVASEVDDDSDDDEETEAQRYATDLALADEHAVDRDQDWTAGATVFTFADGSRVRFCGAGGGEIVE